MRIREQDNPISTWQKVLIFILIYSVMPIVPRAVSTFLTTYVYMLVILLTFALIVFGRHYQSLNEYFLLLFPFIAYSALTYLTRSVSLVLWGYQTLLLWLPVALGVYIVKYNAKMLGSFCKTLLIVIVITAVTTLIGVIQYPMASRILATIDSSQDALAVLYSWHNIGGYDFIYTIVLLYPVLILAYKRKKIKSFHTLLLTVIIFSVVIASEYATALLLIIISSVLFFLKNDFEVRDLLILILFAVIGIVLFYGIIAKLLLLIANNLDSVTMAERLQALAGGKAGLEASEDERIFLYRRSLNTFLSHPILGTFISGGGGSGGHSAILDTLAQYGLVGLIVLVFMYRKIYRYFVAPFQHRIGFGYVMWIFVQAVLLSTINTGMWLWVLTVYVPIFLCAIYKDGGKKGETALDRKYANRYFG